MPFVYRGNLKDLEGHAHFGDGDCVTLIKALVPGLIGLSTRTWKKGETVVGSKGIEPGTAIATFEDGVYPSSRDTRKHAAIFLAYGGAAIYVIDQWKDDKDKKFVGYRIIHPHRPMANGKYANPSNSAGAFSVIELK